MAMRKSIWLFFFASILFSNCTTVQHISKADVQYNVIKSDATVGEDEHINTIVAPYKAQLDKVMNEILAVFPAKMAKDKPESTMGNWVTDAIVERLRNENYEIDFATVNYGGLRIPDISAGPVTMGKIFELAPFDNTILVVDIPGAKLDSFLLLMAEMDGWPVSKEAKLVINNKKLVSAQINGKPIDPNKIYKVATVDYVATGGDNMKVLIPLARKETGLLFRDILIKNLKDATAAGKEVTAKLDGRISRN
jgi:2',3'-cyclic-nucleotide 2'-phosphodiesterase (5'-nucleotidase family)